MTMQFAGERTPMRVFIGESDRCRSGKHKGKPLYEAFLLMLRGRASFCISRRPTGEIRETALGLPGRVSRLTDEMRAAAAPIWEAQLAHPFVRGIADGTLDPQRFERWVRQDWLYLVEFARVFAWAAAKADRLTSMSWFAGVLDLTLNTEMALHREYAARFGITEAELDAEEMWPTTRAYTDFLVRTAAAEDMAGLLAALLPCAWGYAWLGARLDEGGPPRDPRYADWIRQYSAPEFQEAAEWLRTELERVAGAVDDEERVRLIDLFVLSSRYEHSFWDMCWNGESWEQSRRPG